VVATSASAPAGARLIVAQSSWGTPWASAVVLGVITAIVVGLTALQNHLWPGSPHPRGLLDWVTQAAMVMWIAPLPPALFCTLGFLIYRRPRSRLVSAIKTPVSFRVVTRGHNADVVRETVANVHRVMAAMPLFPYIVEVVTDNPVTHLERTREILVPPTYQTSQGSRYKARALQFALEHSGLPDDAWIVHLDEETQLTPAGAAGICEAVDQEELSGLHRIGQGPILYHRRFATSPWLSLIDMVRTGDDLGRFYLQHRLGVTLFGLHGSYIVVRNSVEKEVGFDFGPRGSITEDAFWALAQMGRGRRCRWVEGYLVEQPPASWLDFVRQRRRWFCGLVLCSLFAPAPLRYRVALSLCTAIWGVSWIGTVATYMDLLVGQYAPLGVRVSGNLVLATFVICYLLGLHENLAHLGRVSVAARLFLYLLLTLVIPIFTMVEAASIIYSIVRPEGGFHVIDKPASSGIS
jgi:egghead protein (zeste-white 4 protein)